MGDQLDLVQQAKKQLIVIEKSADELLHQLAVQDGAGAWQNVKQTQDAVNKFDSAIAQLQPLLSQIESDNVSPKLLLSPAILEALWHEKNISDKKNTAAETAELYPQLTTTIPPAPIDSLASLLELLINQIHVTSIELVTGETSVELKSSTTKATPSNTALPAMNNSDKKIQQILIGFRGIFKAEITLRDPGSLVPSRVSIGPINKSSRQPSFSSSSSYYYYNSGGGGMTLWHRLSVASIEALDYFINTNNNNDVTISNGTDLNGSVLEMLVAWLAACAASMTRPRDSLLITDQYTNTLIPSLPSYKDMNRNELWKAALAS